MPKFGLALIVYSIAAIDYNEVNHPGNIFCDVNSGRCMASEVDRIYFGTDNHLSPLGANLVIRKLADHLNLKIPAFFRE